MLNTQNGTHMKIVNLEQGTPEWHQWRSTLLGASDVPAVLNKSPWASAYDLYLTKTGKAVNEETANQAYGKAREKEVLDLYMNKTGKPLMPACIQSEVSPFMGASLDGATFDFLTIVEVKCPSAEVFAMAKKGVLPIHYMLQVQAQLYCVNGPTQASDRASLSEASVQASVCDYVAYHKGEIAIVRVEQDPKFEEHIPILREFWERTQAGIEPEILADDCVLIENNPAFEKASKAYWELKELFDKAKDDFEAAKAELLAHCNGLSMKGYGTKVSVNFKKGNVDYSQIPQLKGIDLEQYRKQPYKETRIFRSDLRS